MIRQKEVDTSTMRQKTGQRRLEKERTVNTRSSKHTKEVPIHTVIPPILFVSIRDNGTKEVRGELRCMNREHEARRNEAAVGSGSGNSTRKA